LDIVENTALNYQINPLNADDFSHLFGLDDESLARHHARRIQVTTKPGYPCRVTLEDASVGESVLLLNYQHLPAASPYRSSHAIFVRERVPSCLPIINEIPEQLKLRLLSIRAFSADGMMVDADVVDGNDCESLIRKLLTIQSVDYLHIHNAKRGCYAARVDKIQTVE
jgi:hypothetical protein